MPLNVRPPEKSGAAHKTLKCLYSPTHDDNVCHALEGGLFDFGDLVLVDAQLLQALGHVGWHLLEHVL